MAETAQLSSNQVSSNSQRWLVLAVLFLARTSMGYQFETVGAIGPILIDAWAIDFTWLGTLIGLYMLPGAFVAIPSGLIGQRFGAKRIVLFGLVMMAAGGVLTATESLQLAFAGRLISGIGGVIMNVMMTKMVADWFAVARGHDHGVGRGAAVLCNDDNILSRSAEYAAVTGGQTPDRPQRPRVAAGPDRWHDLGRLQRGLYRSRQFPA